MNEDDASRLTTILEQGGCMLAESPELADVVLLHTCSVREKPEQRVYALANRMQWLKRKNPGLVLGIGGCVAKQEGRALLERFWGIDFLFDSYSLHKIPELLRAVRESSSHVAMNTMLMDQPEDFDESLFPCNNKTHGPTAFLTIMQGCDHKCSFCIVPHVRGPEVSRSSRAILMHARRLVGQGVRELVLLGQNVNRYGKHTQDITFPELLRELDRIPGLERIRFTTSNPTDADDSLVECFASLRTVCPHLHLPVQSGSDRILGLMRRGYTRKDYLAIVERLRQARPDIALTTDLIVGFPTETDEDFQSTLRLVEEVGFDSSFSFKYSKRPLTEAEKMEGQVSKEVKEERLAILQDVTQRIAQKSLLKAIGSSQEVLVEKPSKMSKEEVMGRTLHNKAVVFFGNQSLVGKIVPVLIIEALRHTLRGQLDG
jgi:tRNA-2-methylthio-N6-dimethylallyladenosine synthase